MKFYSYTFILLLLLSCGQQGVSDFDQNDVDAIDELVLKCSSESLKINEKHNLPTDVRSCHLQHADLSKEVLDLLNKAGAPKGCKAFFDLVDEKWVLTFFKDRKGVYITNQVEGNRLITMKVEFPYDYDKIGEYYLFSFQHR